MWIKQLRNMRANDSRKEMTAKKTQKISLLATHVFFGLSAIYLIISELFKIPTIEGEKVWAYLYLDILHTITFFTFALFINPIFFNKEGFKKKIIISFVAILIYGVCNSYLLALKSASITYQADGSPSVVSVFLSFGWFFASVIYFIPIGLVSFFYTMAIHLIRTNNMRFFRIIDKKEAELKLLKSQVNPHFLFNSMNIIYATALEEGSPKTAETTAKLSNLIRYMMEDINMEFIPLEKEVKYIKDYINIQLSRCSAEQTIEIQIENIENKIIAPGLLISFIENAFKHGINPAKSSYFFVKISGNKLTTNFECRNSISKKQISKNDGLGIGIENVRQRLDLIYPKKHTFKTEKKNDIFTVMLQIQTI